VPRIATLPLGDLPLGVLALASHATLRRAQRPDGIGTTGSHVPCQRPDQARAASMPDTTWAVDRYPPGSSRAICAQPSFDVVLPISTRHQRFALARLLGPHLTDYAVRLFRNAHHPAVSDDAACGGLQPPPAGRPRRVDSSIASTAASTQRPHLHPDSFRRSWRTALFGDHPDLRGHGAWLPAGPGHIGSTVVFSFACWGARRAHARRGLPLMRQRTRPAEGSITAACRRLPMASAARFCRCNTRPSSRCGYASDGARASTARAVSSARGS
jgi:hypothetical protein